MIRNRLYISNIDEYATIEEIISLIEKYSECTVANINRVDSDSKDGTHCYIADMYDVSPNYLTHLNNTILRLHDLWWKNRHIHASLMI